MEDKIDTVVTEQHTATAYDGKVLGVFASYAEASEALWQYSLAAGRVAPKNEEV